MTRLTNTSCLAPRYAVAAFLVSVALGGCTTTNRYSADYSDDVCRTQRDALQETGNHFAEDMVAGIGIGAIGGAALGVATTFLTGGNVAQAALKGAVLGAISGFAVTYYNSLTEKGGGNPGGLFAVFQGDVARDVEEVAKTQRAFDALIDCRRREIASVKSAVKSGTLSRKDGDVKMAAIREKLAEDARVGRAIQGKLEDRTAQYAVAGAKLGLPGAKSRAERAYSQRARTNSSGASDKPDLNAVVAHQQTRSPDAKKAGASMSSMFAGTDNVSKKADTLASLADKEGSGFAFRNILPGMRG